MQGPETKRLSIEKIVAGGTGMGRLDGKVVFVPYSLPGEEVEVVLEKRNRDYLRARLHRVLRPSPKRIPPPCPLFTFCGGCDLQHLAYQDQKDVKRDIFRESFRRIGGIDLEELAPEKGAIPFVESSPLAYRNRAQVHKGQRGGWGFKAAGSRDVVELSHCPVVSPEINLFFAGKSGAAPLPEEKRLVLFGTGGDLYHRRDQEIRLDLGGRSLLFSLDCFFQSNLAMLEKMVSHLFADLSGDLALDLYGGVGTFSTFLAQNFRRVLLVEENPVAAAYARKNLPPRGTQVFTGSVEDWIAAGAKGEGREKSKKPDLVMVDPPRSGLSIPVRRYLQDEAPSTLLYLSCDAVSLARDTGFLLSRGYELADWAIYDFYPQTSHLECLCRFVPKS